ncbi:MAG: phosphoglycerate mutase [Flavobacteriaceae bacterium]|nr:MAG: phosphoglycerate mutase [Flavobacteriaceae bacterium]
MIYLIRHTKPLIAPGICYGQSDLEVSDSFMDEVAVIQSKISIDDSFVCISSPLKRCRKLAEALCYNKTILYENALKELDFGDWENIAWNHIPKKTLKEWSDNFVVNVPPNGESLQQLSNRVLNFWKTLDHTTTNYIITAHDGVLRVILAKLLETPLKKAFTLKLNYGEVLKINFFDAENCRIEFK